MRSSITFQALFKDFRSSLQNCVRSKALFLGSLASAFEWYDYALFGYFAALLGEQFFPSSDPLTSLLSSFAVFASGFLMRPLGAIFFGYIGDRIGRKKALVGSLFLMALPTVALGLLPTYASVGIWASLGLVLVRLLQGLAVGGNYGGSFIFTVEQAKPSSQGLAGSLAMFGTLGGLFLGSGMATLLSFLCSESFMNLWGWRIPFLLGGMSAFLGYKLRHYVCEDVAVQGKEASSVPLTLVFKDHLKTLFQSMGMILLDGVGVYIVFVYMTVYAPLFLGLPKSQVLCVNTIAMSSLVAIIPLLGWLGDRFSARRILAYVSLFYGIGAPLLFCFLIYDSSIFSLSLFQGLFSLAMGAAYGTLPIMVVRAFPRNVRYTACGLAFNISVTVFGGTSPLLVTGLIHWTGWIWIPAVFLSFVGLISYFSIRFLRPSCPV